MARNQEFDLANCDFLKISRLSFGLFFHESNIVELGIDRAVCEEIPRTDWQLLLN